jgi:hypothetical protein
MLRQEYMSRKSEFANKYSDIHSEEEEHFSNEEDQDLDDSSFQLSNKKQEKLNSEIQNVFIPSQ